jgi:hypothetical protein
LLIPGCRERDPGVFVCATVHEYQHCRTLMTQGRIFGCRAGGAFDGGFAEPVAAEAGTYTLDLDSMATITVHRGERGLGKVKGRVHFELAFDPPQIGTGSWCLQRDRYLFYPTGPKGGLGEIDSTAECQAPITGTIEPHEDDILQAYDMCDSFAAWGTELQHHGELLAAALYHIGSAHPAFTSKYGSSTVIAPYLTVRAPFRVICRP